MSAPDDRIYPLDLVRGSAILGMILVNAGAIFLPFALSLDPAAGTGKARDALLWLAEFALLDGRMRALLAMLFGASALLVIDRAEMDGSDGMAVQRRRLLWLLPIGAAHYLLVWQGDILLLLGFAGLIALRLIAAEPLELIKWALAALLLQMLLNGVAGAYPLLTASAPAYGDWLQRTLVQDIALYRGDYLPIAADRAVRSAVILGYMALHALPETLCYMLLGMALAKSGFFIGQWTPASYRQTAVRAYLAGLLPSVGLGLWLWRSGDPRLAELIGTSLALPFRLLVTIGHAALLTGLAVAGAGALGRRVAAVGRLALSSYIAAGIVLTSLSYGYGLGLYGRLDRLAILTVGAALCLLLLAWAPAWLAYRGAGPAERLWRRLYSRT